MNTKRTIVYKKHCEQNPIEGRTRLRILHFFYALPNWPVVQEIQPVHITVLLETTPTRKKEILLFSSRAETNNPVNRRKRKRFRSLAERDSLTLKQTCSQNGSAMCVQNFNDSRGLAIRITYRISLRSSSLWEPRHPLLKVVSHSIVLQARKFIVEIFALFSIHDT